MLKQGRYWVGGTLFIIFSIPLVAYAANNIKKTPIMKAQVADVQTVILPVVEKQKEKVAPVTQTPSADKQQVTEIIKQYSVQYGVNSNLALRIAEAESGYNCRAQNSHSSAGGIYQFLDSTFLATQKQMGMPQDLSQKYDCDINIHLAIWKIAHGGISAWDASKHIWYQGIHDTSLGTK